MDTQINSMPSGDGKPTAMTSLEIADLVGKRHDNVKRTIDTLVTRAAIQLPQSEEVRNHLGQTIDVYLVGERDSYVVVAQLSPEFTARLVDYWQMHRLMVPQLPTTAEAFANAFRLLADSERRQAQQAAEMKYVSSRIDIIEQQAPLKAKPQNAETRSEVRIRMNRLYGLSGPIVDTVLDHEAYGLRPFGMVKNSHEDAQGSSYGVYWIRDISFLFKRFASECKPHSETMVRHVIIARPFKLKPPVITGMITAGRKS